MMVNLKENDLDKIVVMGNKVLIKPKNPQEKTESGLFLPPSVAQTEKIGSGYVIKTGPGYPLPIVNDYDEPWKSKNDIIKYIPLQVNPGDLALYLKSEKIEIKFNGETYHIVSADAILM